LIGAFSGGGYVAVNNQNVAFPSIAVNKDGKGAIGFSIIGPGLFPGAGYAKVSLPVGAIEVKLTAPTSGQSTGPNVSTRHPLPLASRGGCSTGTCAPRGKAP